MTTNRPLPVRFANVASARAALVRNGHATQDEAAALAGKALRAAWDAAREVEANRTEPATPAKTKPVKPAKKPAEQPGSFPLCGCGCGVPTVTAKATFLSGHDARHAGNLGRALAADPTDADLIAAYGRLTPALQAKVDRVRTTAERKVAEKAAKAAAREAAKAAYEAALAAAK